MQTLAAAGSTEGTPEGEPARTSRAGGGRVVVAAAVAAMAPILFAAARGALDGWTPTGDDAFSGVRAWDVFTPHIPLLGTWSSASHYTQLTVNHPGPLHFDLLAIPVRLLGHGAGTALGMGLINAASVGVMAWLLYRRLGAAAATAGMGLAAALAWSMGSEMLYDPWNPYATLFPFALFLVAAWCLVAGDRVALPVLVVAGTYVLQTHLSYSVLVPGMAAFAVAAVGVRLWSRRRRDRAAWPGLRRQALRWGGLAVFLTLLCWAQPIIQQFTTDEQGNLTGLLRSVEERERTPGLGRTLRAFGGTVAVPPAWLPPSFGSPPFDLDGSGHPTWLAGGALVVLAGLLAVLGRRAARRGSGAVAAGALTALAALALGLFTALRAPIVFEMVPTYFRWMWAMGMVVWLAVAAALLDELRSRRLDPQRRASPAPVATAGRPGDGDGDPTGDGDGDDPTGDVSTPTAGAGTALPGDGGEPAGASGPSGRRAVTPPRGWALALPGLTLAVVAGAAALPRVDHGTASPPWTIEIIDAVDEQVAAAVEDEGPLLVELSMHRSVLGAGPALFAVLQDAGVEFYVEDWTLVRQLGDGRRYEPGKAGTRLRVTGDISNAKREGERLVAAYLPLSRAERRELARLNDEVTDLLAENGLVWASDAAAVYEQLDKPDRMAELEEAAAEGPAYMVESGLLRSLLEGGEPAFAGHPLLDTSVYRPELLDRWAELQGAQDLTLKVYLSPVEDDEGREDERREDDGDSEGGDATG